MVGARPRAATRGTSDLSAVLPGAVLFSVTLAGMEAVTQLYLPGRFDHASALYGSIGVTVVTLGWFFILGRILVLSMTINAVVYERIGSVSIFIFGLPLVRNLPRRWPWVADLIGLDHQDRAAASTTMTHDEPRSPRSTQPATV